MSRKSKEKTKTVCNACTKYDLQPFWGHQDCSHHRLCAKSTEWDPFHCNDCKRQFTVLETIEDEVHKKQFFTEMYKMLDHTRKYKKDRNNSDWSFDEPIKAFFWKIKVPARSELIMSTPTNNGQDNEQATENAGSNAQSSVRTILSDETIRNRLDNEMSDLIQNQIDQSCNSVDEYLNGDHRLYKNKASSTNINERNTDSNIKLSQNKSQRLSRKDAFERYGPVENVNQISNQSNFYQNKFDAAPGQSSHYVPYELEGQEQESFNVPSDGMGYDNYDDNYNNYEHSYSNETNYYDEDPGYSDEYYDEEAYYDESTYSDNYSYEDYGDYEQNGIFTQPTQYYTPNYVNRPRVTPRRGSFAQHINNDAYGGYYNNQNPHAAQRACGTLNNAVPFQGTNCQNQMPAQSMYFPNTIQTKEVDWDPVTGQYWVNFNPRVHVKKPDNKMEIISENGSTVVDVHYRVGNLNQFVTVGIAKSNSIAPIIDSRVAHSTLMSTFNRNTSTNNFGAKFCAYESHIEPGQCLAKTCDLIRKHLPHMMAAAANNKEKDLLDAFSKQAFDAVSIADFTQGWNLSSTSSYATFAKDKPLDPAEFATQLGVRGRKFSVPQFLLKGEQVERQNVNQCLTQLHNHDLYGEK